MFFVLLRLDCFLAGNITNVNNQCSAVATKYLPWRLHSRVSGPNNPCFHTVVCARVHGCFFALGYSPATDSVVLVEVTKSATAHTVPTLGRAA